MDKNNGRVQRGFRLRADTLETLQELVDDYAGEAPAFVRVSRRVVVEALIAYAARKRLPFEELFAVLKE